MNCRSVALQVCETAARPFPPRRSTSAPVATIARTSPAAAEKRGFTPRSSAAPAASLHHPFGVDSEDQAAIRAMAPHPDPLVDPGWQAHSPAGRTGTPLGRPPAATGRDRASPAARNRGCRSDGSTHTCWTWTAEGRPRRGLRLEPDRTILAPHPGSPLLDLRARPPAEAVRVACHRIDADLLRVRGRAGGEQQLEVALGSGARKPVSPGLGRLRGSRTRACPGRSSRGAGINPAITAQSSSTARSSPMIMRAAPARRNVRETAALAPGGDDVRADVAQRRQRAVGPRTP